MLESDIEKWLCRELKSLGCIADKFVSPGCTGVPDRIVIIPGGKIFFVELKTDKGRLSKIQKWQKRRYEAAGARVFVVHGAEEAIEFVELVKEVLSGGVSST